MNAKLVILISRLIDAWVWLKIHLRAVALALAAAIICYWPRANTVVAALGHRGAATVDLTQCLRWFYRLETTHTCAQLGAWITRCGLIADTITIHFMRQGALYVSHVDIGAKKELTTGSRLMFGACALDKLPGQVFEAKLAPIS
jgi:hypothetical protein